MFFKNDSQKEIQELRPLIDEYVTEMMISLGVDEAEKIKVSLSDERLRAMSSTQRQQLLEKLREFHKSQQSFHNKMNQAMDDFKKNNPDF